MHPASPVWVYISQRDLLVSSERGKKGFDLWLSMYSQINGVRFSAFVDRRDCVRCVTSLACLHLPSARVRSIERWPESQSGQSLTVSYLDWHIEITLTIFGLHNQITLLILDRMYLHSSSCRNCAGDVAIYWLYCTVCTGSVYCKWHYDYWKHFYFRVHK